MCCQLITINRLLPLSPVAQGLKFMLEVEDDPDWLTSDNSEDDEENMRWVGHSVT